MKKLRTASILFSFILVVTDVNAQQDQTQETFFTKQYDPHPLPQFNKTKHSLPHPICREHPIWVKTYWKTWELAFKNFYTPTPGSGFVSPFADAAFNKNIFFWDTAIMTMFLNTAHPLVPGISSLDNFYVKQHPTGEICREINRASGVDFKLWRNTENLPLFSRWGFVEDTTRPCTPVRYLGREVPTPNPVLTLDALNHPIAAWAELESYRWTADTSRLVQVILPLTKYYEALKKYIRQGNGLYITDWASMDNSPRNSCLANGGTGIDISSEMVLFARNLADISTILGHKQDAQQFTNEADSLATIINKKMWNERQQFYFDLTINEEFCPVKTIAAFWTLVSKTATPERAAWLADQLQNPKTFGRLHPVPTLAADEENYYPGGGYWSGSVWTATNTMVLKGLEAYGYDDLAEHIARKHLDAMASVYKKTGTIWENYAADGIKEGIQTNGKPVVRDMVGFSGVTPILHFLWYGIGLRPDAPHNQLVWKIDSPERCGCKKFRFNGHVVDLISRPMHGSMSITVRSDGDFILKVLHDGKEKSVNIVKGKNYLML